MRRLPLAPTLLLAGACVTPPDLDPTVTDGSGDGSGARLVLDHLDDRGVVGFHLEITRDACSPEEPFTPFELTADVDLLDVALPGTVDLLGQTLDPSSQHWASDLFVTLEPGCYDVLAAPASAFTEDGWVPSEACKTAAASGVEVVAGATTDVTLVSQCLGDPVGALDTLVLLNHPPHLEIDLEEKFGFACEAIDFCVTVWDPDDDPVRLRFVRNGAPLHAARHTRQELVGYEDGHRVWRDCARVALDDIGTFELEVKARDLATVRGWDIPIAWLTGEPSSASLSFPVHIGTGYPLCFDDLGDLVPAPGVSVRFMRGCAPVEDDVYWCSGDYDVDPEVAALVCDGGDVDETRLYPECS